MTPQYVIDWRSILVGFFAACTAFATLMLAAPIQDKLVLAGAFYTAAAVSAVLAFRAKAPAAAPADAH